jgi:hypothetical protein
VSLILARNITSHSPAFRDFQVRPLLFTWYPLATHANGARPFLHVLNSADYFADSGKFPTITLFVHLTTTKAYLYSYCIPSLRLLPWPYCSSSPRQNTGVSATLSFLHPGFSPALTSSRYIPHPTLYCASKVRPGTHRSLQGSDMQTAL